MDRDMEDADASLENDNGKNLHYIIVTLLSRHSDDIINKILS